jgi:ABC-2 type transport system ATP-binding protein
MTISFDLDKVFVARGGMLAVAGISYAHQGAGWIGVVGANGSGKTTLLRAVAGRLPLARGPIRIDGRDLGGDRAERARLIGFAPDANFLPEDLSPGEIFALASFDGASNGGASGLESLRAALDIDRFMARRIGALSAGSRQRIAIYSAFVNRPRMVILDEPFNWLDPLTAYETKCALRDLVEQGLLLVTALHDVSTLTSYCSRGLLLAGGAAALEMERDELAAGARDPLAFEHSIVEHLRQAPEA